MKTEDTKHKGESLRLTAQSYGVCREYAELLGVPISAAAGILIRTGAGRLELFTAPIGAKRQRRAKQ